MILSLFLQSIHFKPKLLCVITVLDTCYHSNSKNSHWFKMWFFGKCLKQENFQDNYRTQIEEQVKNKDLTVSDVSRAFLGRLLYTLNPRRYHHGSSQVCKFSKFVPSDTLKMYSLVLPVFRFVCKAFSKLLKATLSNISFLKSSYIQIKICMAIHLRQLQSDLNWKHEASSTEEITRSSVKYSQHLINGSRFVKKSRRKSEHLHNILWI